MPRGFPVRHKRRRKKFGDESQSSEDANQQETEQIWFRNNVFIVALDNIISALDTHFQTTAVIYEEFSAILKLKDLEEDQIHPACHSLVSKYTEDLTAGFENEVRHLKSVYNASQSVSSRPAEFSLHDEKEHFWRSVRCSAHLLHSTCLCFWYRKGFQQVETCQKLRSTQTQERFNSS